MRRSEFIRGALSIAAAGALPWRAFAADAWQPRRPIEIVVPAAPGGGLDLVGRTLQRVGT